MGPCIISIVGGGQLEIELDYLLLFGSGAVGLMLLTYWLEDRSHWCTLAFAGACALSSVYGWAAGAYPFGVIEAVWSLMAIRRWQRRMSGEFTIASR